MGRGVKPSASPHLLAPFGERWQVWRSSPSGWALVPDAVPSRCPHLTACPQTGSFFTQPLWIPVQGDASELATLELSSRHLIRSDQVARTIPIRTQDDRALVLAVVSEQDGELAGLVPLAEKYTLPAGVLDPQGAQLAIWQELGHSCFAFYDGNNVLYSAPFGMGMDTIDPGLLLRIVLRLRAEEVLTGPISEFLVIGDIPPAFSDKVARLLSATSRKLDEPPLRTPESLPDLPAPATVALRSQRHRTRRMARVALAAALLYSILILALTAVYVRKAVSSQEVVAEAKRIVPEAEAAREKVSRWRTLRPALDPDSFALDQLAAVARALPSDTVRLTQVNFDPDQLLINGEASEVSQTYAMFESLKGDPLLAAYEWSAAPPDIAGRNNVKFSFEGRRLDAGTESE